MSIPYSGTIKRSGGLSSAIAKQIKLLSLKPVRRVQFNFDPFHNKIEETRNFMFHITSKKATVSNLTCAFKTNIICDRTDPSVTFKLVNGEEVIFKSANLSALEMLQLFNKHITVLAPKDDSADAPKTKLDKKALKARK